MGVFDFLGVIWDLLRAAWDWLKKIVLRIINFFKNIAAFFRDRRRLRKIQQNKKIIATAIKENLENGNVNVINCLFDTEEGELVDEEIDAQVMTAENMDEQTKANFGDKDMLVLR